jgi:hypothetical protein
MKAEVVEARIEDCDALVEAMDEEGRALLRTGWGVAPLEGLQATYLGSGFRWTVLIDGEVAGMFGCMDGDEPGVGYPWLVTAPAIERVKLRFIRQSLGYVKKIFEWYELLVCHAHKDNKALLGWIRWLGFDLEDMGNGFVKGRLEKCACRR